MFWSTLPLSYDQSMQLQRSCIKLKPRLMQDRCNYPFQVIYSSGFAVKQAINKNDG